MKSWYPQLLSMFLLASAYQANAVPTDVICPKGFFGEPSSRRCYGITRFKDTWSNAQKQCRQMGGDLASLRDKNDEEYALLWMKRLGLSKVWIGVKIMIIRRGRRRHLQSYWLDQTPMDYTNWYIGPFGPDYCTMLTINGWTNHALW